MTTMDQDPDFDPLTIERRWRERWEADTVTSSPVDELSSEQNFYNIVEFSYPSAEGLHVWHV